MNSQEYSVSTAGAYPSPPLAPEEAPRKPVKMTLEEFLESGLEGYEYVEGELIPRMPTSLKHGTISLKLGSCLFQHVDENRLGNVYPASTGFRVGERLLIPDIAFVSIARIPEDADKASPIPPDLAVEVVSPSETLAAHSAAGASSGNGNLATIFFEVTAQTASALTLSDVVLTDSEGKQFFPLTGRGWIGEPPPIPGDVNSDRQVDTQDLEVVASRLGEPGHENRADVNEDGVVDIADLVWITRKIQSASSSTD